MNNLLAVNIRPHLISFLFQELAGEIKADVEGTKAKLAKVSRSSLLGSMIKVFEAQAIPSCKATNSYTIFLRIDSDGEREAAFHKKTKDTHKNTYTILELLPEHVRIVNDLLENQFRLSAVEFIKGYANSDSSVNKINKAINQFMIHHNLYDTEIDPESLRRMYYNSLKKKHSLARLQNQTSTRSMYYYSA